MRSLLRRLWPAVRRVGKWYLVALVVLLVVGVLFADPDELGGEYAGLIGGLLLLAFVAYLGYRIRRGYRGDDLDR